MGIAVEEHHGNRVVFIDGRDDTFDNATIDLLAVLIVCYQFGGSERVAKNLTKTAGFWLVEQGCGT